MGMRREGSKEDNLAKLEAWRKRLERLLHCLDGNLSDGIRSVSSGQQAGYLRRCLCERHSSQRSVLVPVPHFQSCHRQCLSAPRTCLPMRFRHVRPGPGPRTGVSYRMRRSWWEIVKKESSVGQAVIFSCAQRSTMLSTMLRLVLAVSRDGVPVSRCSSLRLNSSSGRAADTSPVHSVRWCCCGIRDRRSERAWCGVVLIP